MSSPEHGPRNDSEYANFTPGQDKGIRLHLTNIAGLGAVSLLESLIPALLDQRNYKVVEAYLPTSGTFSKVTLFNAGTTITYYRRFVPNAISRLLECTVFGSKFNGASPLIVFGDIPIRCKSTQTVFFQNTLLVRRAPTGKQLGAVKYWVARWLFRRNAQYVTNFIVQTEAVKSSLIDSYPEISDRIHVIGQPAPSWLIDSGLTRTEFHKSAEMGLQLFYPAAGYPHKNHRLFSEVSKPGNWPVSKLLLTIPQELNPNPDIPWIHCVGRLQPDEVLNAYRTTDALLFLSLSESLGFPLVEAMWIGLPIICPDLPYARTLCGEQAIYFDPQNASSLHAAIVLLNERRLSGWWPDWTANLEKIPRDWQEVANAILQLGTAKEANN